jgi:hypothetical protein
VERTELELTSEPELDQTLQLGWARSHAKWRYYVCEQEEDWSEAAVFVVQYIEQTIELYGELYPALDGWWLLLEEALEKSGQFERLKQANEARVACSRRLAAEMEEEERLEEEAWVARQAMEAQEGDLDEAQWWENQEEVAVADCPEVMDWMGTQAVQDEQDWLANEAVPEQESWLVTQAAQEEQSIRIQQTFYGSIDSSTGGWLTVLA